MEAKRSRRSFKLAEKLELLDRMKTESITQISKKCNINESTLRTLQRNEKQLREYAKNCPDGSNVSYVSPWLNQLESSLFEWYTQERRMGRQHTAGEVCNKAKEMYDTLRTAENVTNADDADTGWDSEIECGRYEREFKASRGWFRQFRKRFNLDTIGTQESRIDDPDAVAQHKAKFKRLIRTENYQPQQVFAATEFSLKWKGMPAQSAIARSDRTLGRACSDRVSMLMCGNASGDFMVKPIMVYRAAAPKCMRFISYNELPVFWRSRPRTNHTQPAVTMEHFHEWLHECFAPSVRDYLHIMEYPSRCLLLVDKELEPFVETFGADRDADFLRFECMPRNSALHPLGRTVVPLFQCRYYEQMYKFYHGKLASEPNARQFFAVWRDYSIANAIDTMHWATEDLTAFIWRCGWRALWPEIVQECTTEFASTLKAAIERVVDACRCLPGMGFTDMTEAGVCELLQLKPDHAQTASVPNETTVSEAERLEDAQATKRKRFESSDNVSDACRDILKKIKSDINSDDSNDLSDDDLSDGLEEYLKRVLHDEEQPKPCNNDKASTPKGTHGKETVLPERQTRSAKASTSDGMLPERSQRKLSVGNRQTLRTLKQAFAMSQRMSDLMATVRHHGVDHAKFTNDLSALMQPYKDLRERLLQTSIEDYFKQK